MGILRPTNSLQPHIQCWNDWDSSRRSHFGYLFFLWIKCNQKQNKTMKLLLCLCLVAVAASQAAPVADPVDPFIALVREIQTASFFKGLSLPYRFITYSIAHLNAEVNGLIPTVSMPSA